MTNVESGYLLSVISDFFFPSKILVPRQNVFRRDMQVTASFIRMSMDFFG